MGLDHKPTVLLETEGSYPFSGGGISTWAHTLCKELNEKIDFIIFTLTGNPNVSMHYQIPDNIKSVIHIPLWGAEDPMSYYDQNRLFSSHLEKKNETTPKNIESLFFPIFRDFVDCLVDPLNTMKTSPQVIYGLWKFFQHFDYKITMTNLMLWEFFKGRIYEFYSNENGKEDSEIPRLMDVTFGMRWLYHFLMPLAASIPKVDLTHTTLAGFPAIPSIVSKFEYGIPGIATDHGVFIRERHINVSTADFPYFSKKLLLDLSTLITSAVYTTVDEILPVSSFNKSWEMLFGADNEKIKVINNGIDPLYFVPKPKPAQTANVPTVLAVNHVFPLKDIETMIKACDIVRKSIPEVQFRVYGSLTVDKDYVTKCRELVKELNVEQNFTFAGFHSNPQQVYNEGDIYILTSISEGAPYTVMEAMSCARPVVATDVGGVREIIQDNGILCQPRNPVQIADAVIKMLKDNDMRVRLGRNARDRILLYYTKEQSVNSYLETYMKLIQKPKNPLKNHITVPSVKRLLEYIGD